jgi:alkanesulfonate monooxygenase SsuD/methylene tetrahydromethanopterin reductase-like flavin-dependent oxidoreductase (luciferase family)
MKPSLGVVAVFIAAATAALADTPPTWAVVVRPFGSANREMAESFWVGLRNTSDKDRAFCGLGVRYTFELAKGSLVDRPSAEYPVVGSPHTCADSMGTLVLAGETYFVQVRPRLPSDAVRSAGVRFMVVAEEACLTPNCREHPSIIASEGP